MTTVVTPPIIGDTTSLFSMLGASITDSVIICWLVTDGVISVWLWYMVIVIECSHCVTVGHWVYDTIKRNNFMLSIQFLWNISLAICGVFMASDRVKPCYNMVRK